MIKLIILPLTLLLTCMSQSSQAKVINDIDLDIAVEGQGNVTVVFEAGFGMSKETWKPVISDIASFATTVRYSRAGIGQSAAHAEPADIETHLADLYSIVVAYSGAKPVIMVGHSYGGLLSATFAQRHPDLVKGLVLIDPSVLAQRIRFKALNAQRVIEDDKWLRGVMPAHLIDQYNTLIGQMDKASTEVTPISSLLPTVLFTATQAASDAMVLEETVEGKKVWLALHQELMQHVSRGAHIRVGDSQHLIYRQHPELVIRAIADLVQDVY